MRPRESTYASAMLRCRPPLAWQCVVILSLALGQGLPARGDELPTSAARGHDIASDVASWLGGELISAEVRTGSSPNSRAAAAWVKSAQDALAKSAANDATSYDAAVAVLSQAAALEGEPLAETLSQMVAAIACVQCGKMPSAVPHLRECLTGLDDQEELRDVRWSILHLLAEVELQCSHYQAAGAAFQELIERPNEVGQSPAGLSRGFESNGSLVKSTCHDCQALSRYSDALVALGRIAQAEETCLQAAHFENCSECRALVKLSESEIASARWDFASESRLIEEALAFLPVGDARSFIDGNCRLLLAEVKQSHPRKAEEIAQRLDALSTKSLGDTDPLRIRVEECLGEM
jgi:tetratricopeptide (TPR) repeat protein